MHHKEIPFLLLQSRPHCDGFKRCIMEDKMQNYNHWFKNHLRKILTILWFYFDYVCVYFIKSLDHIKLFRLRSYWVEALLDYLLPLLYNPVHDCCRKHILTCSMCCYLFNDGNWNICPLHRPFHLCTRVQILTKTIIS